MKNKVLLCVDVSNIVYKSAAAHSTLSSDGVFTGGLYGFLMAIAKAVGDTGATKIVLCCDSKPYRRSLIYPEYKLLREDTKDPVLVGNAKTTIAQIRELVKVVGWPIWSIPTFESDDLIAHATIQYRHRYDQIIAMSNDSDLYQLFQWPRFALYKGKKGLYTRADYDKEWGLPAHELYLALAMIGTHNCVSGISGIGMITAKKILADPVKYRAIREKHLEVLERNDRLIKLPYPDFPVDTKMPLPTCEYNERELLRFCSRYEISLQRWQCEAFEKIAV
jgi:DNA polymerase-1